MGTPAQSATPPGFTPLAPGFGLEARDVDLSRPLDDTAWSVLSRAFFAGHREEITHLIRHIETKEKGEHPLERIMDARDEGGRHIVTFTSQHITRGAGDAVHHAYQGSLNIRASEKDGLLRIHWQR